MHWRRPELAIVTVIIDGDNRRTEEDHGEKVPPHRKDIGWSRKKRCVWESRFFLYVLAMYVYKSSVVCKCVCVWSWFHPTVKTPRCKCSQNQKMKKTLTFSTNEKLHERFFVSLSASRSVETECSRMPTVLWYAHRIESVRQRIVIGRIAGASLWNEPLEGYCYLVYHSFLFLTIACLGCRAVRALLGIFGIASVLTNAWNTIGWDCDALFRGMYFISIVVGVMGNVIIHMTVVCFQASRRSLDCAAAGSLQ